MIAAAGTRGVAAPTLAARVTLPMPVVVAQASSRSEVVAFGKDPVVFLSRKAVDELAQRLRDHLERFHRENPLKAAVPREELRRRLFSRAAPGVFEGVLESLVAAGELRLSEGGVALAGHSVALRPEEEAARQAILTAAQAGGLAGVEIAELAARSSAGAPLLQRVAQVLLASGILQRVGEKSLVHREHAEELKRRVRERWPAGTRLDVGEFKELTGLSRKFVIPLLEYLDRERVTRRSGNERYTVSSR
jgi:selenocysteine-specific elongation factor